MGRGENFLKKKEQENKKEIQVVKIRTVADGQEEFKILDNKIGMLIEVGLIAALTAFCIFCFLTGMDMPVRKLALSIEIMFISILFWFTFRIDKGSGYIFSGELILYGICSFCFKNEISQGLAAIINAIGEKIMDYYNVSLPLFQEVNDKEQYMQSFLMFIVVMIAGVTAYIVVNKSARFFLCMVQFPIALGSLLVGLLPECLYFLGFVLAVAVLLTMPKQQVSYVSGKKILQSMTVRITALVIGCFALFFGVLIIGVPKNRYETVNIIEYKNQLQERMWESFLGQIGDFGNGSSVGGLSRGQLGRTAKLNYTGRKCLEINVSGEIQLPLYLKSYIGKKFENDHWEGYSEENQEIERKAIRQMENGEEQGAAWMEMFSDMSDWFSKEAFEQYVETDGSYMDERLYDDVYIPQTEDYESWSEGGKELFTEYIGIPVKGYAEGYSYKSLQAILGQKQTTIDVKNIALSPSERFVPYGRILSKDKEQNGVRSYTGYPNLNVYVKGGMEGYGYSSGNFIKGMLERCAQSQNFLNQCISCISQGEWEKIQQSDITLEELIDKVQKNGGKIYSGIEDDKIATETIFIEKENGYYRMSGTYGAEYILYLKSNLKLKDVEKYLDKVWEYADSESGYEAYVKEYKDAGQYTSKLRNICQKFQENSSYATFIERGNADINLSYIGECINFVTEYLADNMEYSLEPGKLPKGENFIDYYLFRQKKGYCSHFATIAVNMFRSLDVPARYVEGFVVKKEDLPKEGISKTIELEDKSAHAWVEIYVEGYGWVPVEVTPGYDNGIEADDFERLLRNWNSMNGDKNNRKNITPTPMPTQNAEPHQTTGEGQDKKSFMLNEKTVKWIITVTIVIAVCGIVILFIWLRYVYVWKKRIRDHSYKLENGRVCNYYAKMETLLKGVRAIEETDSFRDLLNAYVEDDKINQKKAAVYIAGTADKAQWAEFVKIINVAAYSNRDVTGHQLETVRLLEEKMRKEVFASMPKIKIWYYQYIRLL